MKVARAGRVLAMALLVTVVSACDVTVNQPQGEPYQPPPADKIEKAQNKVLLAGRVLVVKEGNIWLLTQDSFRQISSGGRSRQPAWSPDGRQVAFVKMGDNSSDIWLMNADGSNARAITHFASADLRASHWAFQPTWSPDGKTIAYVSEEASFDLALWMMNADGSGRREIAALNAYTGGIDNPAWAPDGTRVAVTAYRNGVAQVWVIDLNTGQWTQLSKSEGGAYDAAWSPDGMFVAYVARDKGTNDIWVVAADGSSPTRVTASGWCRSPSWSPDGAYLGYLNGSGGYFDFWMVKVTPQGKVLKLGEPEQVTKNAQLDPASGLSWSR
jgi:TolB protein